MSAREGLLVVAGEASGDRAAAKVVRLLGGVPAFGMGGDALAAVDAELAVHLRDTTAMGVSEVVGKAFDVGRALTKLGDLVRERRPRAALLVNYSEFNLRLLPLLSSLGTRTVWYGAPQVWAWRPGRAERMREMVDHMCVMLPFEEPIWRDAGVSTRWVGHPAVEDVRGDRREAREALGMTSRAFGVAILPGSRPHEVKRLLGPMLDAYERVRKDWASVDARVLFAPSLDRRLVADAARQCAERRVEYATVDATRGMMKVLPAFDSALVASGTASLECALAGVVPVIAYRVGLATELVARALVRTTRIGLPNVLLGRTAFEELVQRDASGDKLAAALERAMQRPDAYRRACAELSSRLAPRPQPSREVATLLAGHLGARRGLTVPPPAP